MVKSPPGSKFQGTENVLRSLAPAPCVEKCPTTAGSGDADVNTGHVCAITKGAKLNKWKTGPKVRA